MVIAIYLVILVAAFYFLIVRPQRRQSMMRRQILSAVEAGDEIVTTGGVYGTVLAIHDDTLDLEIADGVVVKIARGAVAARITPDLELEDDEFEDDEDVEDVADGEDDAEWDGDLGEDRDGES